MPPGSPATHCSPHTAHRSPLTAYRSPLAARSMSSLVRVLNDSALWKTPCREADIHPRLP
ncbi:hypothetical protein DNK48_30980 [Streptomyces malaysiensis subsp. malaysiensis]|nr:hypothetical protein DNK48_30980 [Streptomyces malaysiensis]